MEFISWEPDVSGQCEYIVDSTVLIHVEPNFFLDA